MKKYCPKCKQLFNDGPLNCPFCNQITTPFTRPAEVYEALNPSPTLAGARIKSGKIFPDYTPDLLREDVEGSHLFRKQKPS